MSLDDAMLAALRRDLQQDREPLPSPLGCIGGFVLTLLIWLVIAVIVARCIDADRARVRTAVLRDRRFATSAPLPVALSHLAHPRPDVP